MRKSKAKYIATQIVGDLMCGPKGHAAHTLKLCDFDGKEIASMGHSAVLHHILKHLRRNMKGSEL